MPDFTRDPNCPPVEETLPALSGPPARPVPPCDPPEVVLPDVFVAPDAVVEYADLPIPPIPSTEVTATVTVTCAADSPRKADPACKTVRALVGADSTAQFSQDFAWELVTGLTDNQRRFLAALPQATRDAALFSGELLPLKLHDAQIDEVTASFQALQADTESKARLAALSALDCAWWNEAVAATCPAGAVDGPAGDFTPVRAAAIAAGTFSSTLSPCEADAVAQAAALAALRCVYTNTEVAVHCFDDPTFPTDPEGTTPRRVGTVTIAPGQYFSTTSTQAATDMATAVALSALNCFFLNAPKSAVCGKDTDGKDPVQNPSDGTSVGNPVTIAAGSITSESSQKAADDEAQTLAASLLDCFFTAEATATCPASPDPDDPANPVAASSTVSPRYSITIPAGTITSPVSQKAAYDTALLMAQAQLECMYCNKEILPRCAPASQMSHVPISTSTDRVGWSLSATSGVAAGTFCAPTYEAAKALADSIGNIPMNVQTTPGPDLCVYGNDEIKAACVINTSERSDTTVSKFETTGLIAEYGLSAASTPSPYDAARRFVYVAANTMTVAVKDIPSTFRPDLKADVDAWGKAYANDLAKRQAESFLNCFWSNERLIVKCRADLANGTASGTKPDRTITYGDGLMKDGSTPSAQATSSVIVAKNQFISFTSQDEANTAAAAMGISQLSCFVGNSEMLVLCGATLSSNPADGTSILTYGTSILTYGDNTMPDGSPITNATDTSLHIGKTMVNQQTEYYDAVPPAVGKLKSMWTRTLVDVTTTTKTTAGATYNKMVRQTIVTYYDTGGAIKLEETYPASESWVILDAANPAVTRVLVPRDSVISYESLTDANFMALATGIGGLVCLAKNDAQWGQCRAEDVANRAAKVEWAKALIPTYEAAVKAMQAPYDAMPDPPPDPKTGEPSSNPAKDAVKKKLDQLSAILANLRAPLGLPAELGFVEAGTIVSMVSIADANQQARTIAQASSQCLVGNDIQISRDGGMGQGDCTPGFVASDTLRAPTRADANAAAATLAEALVTCTGAGGGGGGDGLPGNDGAQTSCDGQCAAYYS